LIAIVANTNAHISILEKNDLSYWDDHGGRMSLERRLLYIETWKWRFGTTCSRRGGM